MNNLNNQVKSLFDEQVANWIKAERGATPKDFEAYLRNLYQEKRLLDIFPNGL